ncbi:hypothetical protein [Flavobacterium chungangense]|uniref:Uncharacterized protein n=1 Tax=Flavobacterium chungangense TaxID=554283 RepID=A0A6V6Z984_9FLAO|nr:hypothetical protein [Flavobacterium chungangense]CAD0008096.1 hypothetical protein FLACHUCJ7_03634 [Flavobacterium chungangense]
MEKDFNPGMKVHLNGEFGLVVKSETDNPNFHGVIRWDTEKEIDLEDWTGMFGLFLSLGGEIIDGKHPFNYINDDGTLK